MLKHATIAVTNKCNSKCTMCNIWNSGITSTEISALEFGNLFSQTYFKELIDVSISGGEPVLRNDISEVVLNITKNLPKLKDLWVNTNGTSPNRVKALFDNICNIAPNEFLCLSIEGNRETHKKVRRIDCYDSAIMTMKSIRANFPNVNVCISMTVTPLNCNLKNLEHVATIAEKNGCSYTFRFANNNDDFYKNTNVNLHIPEKNMNQIIDFSQKHKVNDEFIYAQNRYLRTGIIEIMDNCRAGNDFIFIRPDGTITPCINSSRILEKPQVIENLGAQEKCPCCTECCFYPMLSYKNNHQK